MITMISAMITMISAIITLIQVVHGATAPGDLLCAQRDERYVLAEARERDRHHEVNRRDRDP